MTRIPQEGEHWKHRNGNVYKVLFFTNLPNDERYPMMIVYENIKNKTKWSRLASDWERSFTPVI